MAWNSPESGDIEKREGTGLDVFQQLLGPAQVVVTGESVAWVDGHGGVVSDARWWQMAARQHGEERKKEG